MVTISNRLGGGSTGLGGGTDGLENAANSEGRGRTYGIED